MQGAKVIAGSDGLDRQVRGINIVEVPDVWQWLEGGELLLTAGYAWRDNPEAMADLVGKLAPLGVSGLAFKLGRYLDDVPAELLAHADEVALPIIQLPADIAYRDVLESLYGSLPSRRGQFDLSRQTKQNFIHFSLDEQSIEKVVGALARQLSNEVVAVDLLDEEVVTSSASGVTVRTSFDAMDDTTRALVQELAAQDLHRSPSEVSVGMRRGLGAALVVAHRTHGYLVAVHGDEGLDEGATAAMAHAGELVSFLLLKRLALFEGRREVGGLFLDSLTSHSLTNEEATERALTLGLRLTRPCTVVVLGAAGKPLPSPALDAVACSSERALGDIPHVVSHEPARGTVVALLQIGEADEGLFDRLLQSAQDAMNAEGGGKPLLGCGSPGIGVEGVRRSQSEALIAYETTYRLGGDGIVRFDRLGVERLLAQIPQTKVAKDYVASLIGPLEKETELLRTVEVYLQHGGNKVATAAAIPLHRSSLVYRLQKASKLLGVDLNSPERCLELWLAIRLRRVLMLSGERVSDS